MVGIRIGLMANLPKDCHRFQPGFSYFRDSMFFFVFSEVFIYVVHIHHWALTFCSSLGVELSD